MEGLCTLYVKRTDHITAGGQAVKIFITPQPKNRDGKISQKKVLELATKHDCAEIYEALYPGYVFVDADAPKAKDGDGEQHLYNGEQYIYIRMVRKDAPVFKFQPSRRQT